FPNASAILAPPSQALCSLREAQHYQKIATPWKGCPRRHTVVKIRVRVGPSRVAGQGLFAEQDIKQGTKIIRYIGEKITQEESDRRLAAGNVYIFGLNGRYAIDGSTRKNIARYINHACEPNCQTEQFGNTIWLVAIKDIDAGEELTYNYGYEV